MEEEKAEDIERVIKVGRAPERDEEKTIVDEHAEQQSIVIASEIILRGPCAGEDQRIPKT